MKALSGIFGVVALLCFMASFSPAALWLKGEPLMSAEQRWPIYLSAGLLAAVLSAWTYSRSQRRRSNQRLQSTGDARD